MRSAKYIVFLAVLALLVPLGAFARAKNQRSLVITDPVWVGSTELKAGTYKVEWQGSGTLLSVSFLQYGKTVATTQGKIVEKNNPWPYDDIVITKTGDTPRLDEIDFGGKKDALAQVRHARVDFRFFRPLRIDKFSDLNNGFRKSGCSGDLPSCGS